MTALPDRLAHAPDDTVDEVAGAPFSRAEAVAAIGLGVIALLMGGLMALLLAALEQEHRLSAAGIGQTAMLEALSTGIVAGLAGILLPPRRLKLLAALAALVLVAADLATLRASGLGVSALRLAAGLPEGLLLWITIGFVARTRTPERWTAVLFAGMGLSQVAFATGLSAFLLPRFGANSGYLAVAAAAGLALPLALIAPGGFGPMPGSGDKVAGPPPPIGWVVLFATLMLAASLSAVGIYGVPLAVQAGLTVDQSRAAVPVALGCQIAGALLATVIAGHVRYIWIFLGTGATFFALWGALAGHPPFWLVIVLSGASGLAGTLSAPFLIAMTTEADPSRRTALQSGPVQLLAGALGPFAASLAVREHDAHGVLALGAAMQAFGLLIALWVHYRGAPEVEPKRA